MSRELTPHAENVLDFMRLAGQEIPAEPCVPSAEVRVLRAKLIFEEAMETIDALGVDILDMGSSQRQFVADHEPNLIEIADGCADVSVVTVGTLLACGMADVAILEEVDASNLRKFGPGGHRREDGKWMKPPGWRKPDLERVLREQRADRDVMSEMRSAVNQPKFSDTEE